MTSYDPPQRKKKKTTMGPVPLGGGYKPLPSPAPLGGKRSSIVEGEWDRPRPSPPVFDEKPPKRRPKTYGRQV